MIVDDHPLVRSAVSRAIAGPGVSVVAEVATAEEALIQAPQVAPDVLLVDITLPGMSGVHLVRELAPRLPGTKILMLTVSASDRDVVDAIRNGASGYLTKDVTPEALARAIRAAADGELVMPRRLAARLIERLVRRGNQPFEPEDGPVERLSSREQDVLRLLAEGLSDREIATALTISTRTVESHVSSVLHKLGVRNRAQAAERYRNDGA
jgi:DNA-binding NarL/FixJ family response regulator